MRLLVDQNLALRVAVLLRDAGHDVVHVAERGLSAAKDEEIFELASSEDRVIISEDNDFGTLLARAGTKAPSFVLIRSAEPLTPDGQAALLLNNLGAVEHDLAEGSIVVLARGRVRVRALPIERED